MVKSSEWASRMRTFMSQVECMLKGLSLHCISIVPAVSERESESRNSFYFSEGSCYPIHKGRGLMQSTFPKVMASHPKVWYFTRGSTCVAADKLGWSLWDSLVLCTPSHNITCRSHRSLEVGEVTEDSVTVPPRKLTPFKVGMLLQDVESLWVSQ